MPAKEVRFHDSARARMVHGLNILADGDHFTLVGLLGGGVRDDDSTRGLALFLDALDDHAVMQRTNFHAGTPQLKKHDVLQWLTMNEGSLEAGILELLALSSGEC